MPQDSGTTVLGRYRLRRLLGEGGMGEVYLATATGSAGFEKLVALKMLGAGQSHDTGLVRSLQREALIGVQLDHENVVQILDYGEFQGRAFIAMEYVRGFSLATVIKYVQAQGQKVPIRTIVHVARRVAEALHYMHHLVDGDGHSLELIHGDVSPSNVLLAIDGRIKLTDFGITALAKETQGERMVAGKPGYLPPETLAGAHHAQSWDVYALGAVLYEGLCGRPLYEGRGASELRESFARGLSPVDLHRPDCPSDLCRVVELAVASSPDLRFGTPMDLCRALDEAFPRQLDDQGQHASYVGELFADPTFVKSFGELPQTGGLASTGRLAPYITQDVPDEQDDQPTVAPLRLPALRFGLSPALGSDVAKKHGAHLAQVLSARIGRDVRVIVFADYAALLDCLCQGEVDFAWTPPLTFVEAAERGAGSLVIAKRSGQITYETAMIVRSDAAFSYLEDLRGQAVAWVDRSSSAGYLFAAAEVMRRMGPPSEVFSREHFHGSHRAVCEAVANGWAAAGATYLVRNEAGDVVLSGWTDLLPERASELRILETMGPIPGDGIAHRPGLPERLIRQLVEVLARLDSEPESRQMIMDVFGAESLVPGRLDLYDAVLSAKIQLE